ncbi:putative uracil phosphoribosyltransferase protein [Zymoseptoria brevis]|uniref:Putative uracil phosphoribosyltransferase protein n=1 Tax=Zymoseptoria brevis TaxID=1047168 RepID=A0A0F4G9R6_9PEZI|nr:putative uracil phosphoribosyltransferase protein [Zymoseptoria brevis]
MALPTQYLPLLGTKAKLIAIFGLPGSGKTHLLHHLHDTLPFQYFAFFEGSEVIAEVMASSGGLPAFLNMEHANKRIVRDTAIRTIVETCTASGRIGIMTGHCMFWDEGEENPGSILGHADWAAFTHVLYLKVDPATIRARMLADQNRPRPDSSKEHLQLWQDDEIRDLRMNSLQHDILYSSVSGKPEEIQKTVKTFIADFAEHDEQVNMSRALQHLDSSLPPGRSIETMLVLDGDKTLTASDTGDILWDMIKHPRIAVTDPIKQIFDSPMKYSYTAFRQAALMHSERHDASLFDMLCEEAARKAVIHPEFLAFLSQVKSNQHVDAIVVTCGLTPLWRHVLNKAGLHDIPVIGSGQISHDFVVTPEVKTAVVHRLQHAYHMDVWAFGDSPLDLGMLRQADRAFVVVGDQRTRSKSMESKLLSSIQHGLRAQQILLPPNSTMRLDSATLPPVQLQDLVFNGARKWDFNISHATDKPSAQILMTATRDASFAGPALRQAHHQTGRYLALEYVSEKIGLSSYPIRHVQGHFTNGQRLLDEDKTLIIALMRGGEPMALGVNEAFPLAAFHHSYQPKDVREKNLEGMRAVVLVDSVINNGKSMAEYVNHIRALDVAVRIVVVAGVVQEQAVQENGGLAKQLEKHGRLDLVALRMSSNKYTGKKQTDTGDRLFNTTYLD